MHQHYHRYMDNSYPYKEPHHCGTQCSLNACCDGHFKPDHHVPTPPKHPTGHITENGFRIVGGYPYLCDTTNVKYGPFVNVAEQIDTRIAQRPTSGCVHLDAVFDCTNSANVNGTLLNYLSTIIERCYDTLQTTLPILQDYIHFRIKYYVTAASGETIAQEAPVVSFKESWLHATDIHGYFIQSVKGVLIHELGDFTYYGGGTYTITIESVEVIMTAIDTLSHLEDPALNDFYAFINNYTKIALDHTKISNTEPDDREVIISMIPINKSFMFNAAVTTKIKICFTAYLSDMIVTNNTFGVWKSLTQPTDEIIASLKTRISTLENTCGALETELESATVKITNLETTNAQLISTIEELDERVTALEGKTDEPTDPPSTGDDGGETTDPGTTPGTGDGDDTTDPGTNPEPGDGDNNGETTDTPTPPPSTGDDDTTPTDPSDTPSGGEGNEDGEAGEGDTTNTEPTDPPTEGSDDPTTETPDPSDTNEEGSTTDPDDTESTP